MIRKILVLTLDRAQAGHSTTNQLGYGVSLRTKQKAGANQNDQGSTVPSLPLSENLPTHLHLAAIMGERTQLEKQTFGKFALEHGQSLTENKVDWAISKFIETQSYFELVTEVLDRARDRQATQYSKFEAAIDYQIFYTDQGVEKRNQKVKLKVFSKNQTTKDTSELPPEHHQNQKPMSAEVEKCLRMLQVHNAKVNKIRDGYNAYFELRQQAMAEGITFEELKERVEQEEEAAAAGKKVKSAKPGGAKKSGIAAAKKKFAAKVKNDVDVLIKVKDDEGQVINFEADEDDAVAAAAPAKKKKPKAKTVRVGNELSSAQVNAKTIEAEDTLAMIKNALKSGPNMVKEFQKLDDD